MAYQKGERVEQGIWRLAGKREYLAEINYTDLNSGKRIRERRTSNRLDLARDWRRARKADALRGEVNRPDGNKQPRPFPAFANEYLENWSRVEKANSSYLRDANSVKHLVAFFGSTDIAAIKRRDVERFVIGRKASEAAAGTINRELSCLKNMLRKAVDWEYIDDNPAWGVKQRREEVPEFEYLTAHEMDRLLEACPAHLQPIVIVALYTGMRRGEILNLEWKDVNLDVGDRGLITIRKSKNHDTRYIPMNSLVRETLMKHPKRIVGGKVSDHVFSNRDGAAVKSIRNGFEAAVRRARINKHIRFHDLRHTFASHLVMRGVDLRTVAKLLGHRDIRVTMRYAHLGSDHLQAAVDVLTGQNHESPLQAN